MICWGNEESFIVTATPHDYGFETVSVGGDHACALKKNKVYCWGSNDYNQITPPQDLSLEYKSVEAGTDHTCGILLNGRLKYNSILFLHFTLVVYAQAMWFVGVKTRIKKAQVIPQMFDSLS